MLCMPSSASSNVRPNQRIHRTLHSLRSLGAGEAEYWAVVLAGC